MTYLCVLAMMVELWTRKKEMGDEDVTNIEDTSSDEKSVVRLACFGLQDLVSALLPA
jgi:hypothetical protein